MVQFNKDKTVNILVEGIGWRSIRPVKYFVDEMGFDSNEIKAIEKTHRSGNRVSDTIYRNGKRVSSQKGVFCYEFLLWFAGILGVSTSDIEGGRHFVAMDVTQRILTKLQEQN